MERRSRGGVARRPRAVVAALMLALSALGVVLVVTLARPSPAVVDDDEPAGPSTIDAPREPEVVEAGKPTDLGDVVLASLGIVDALVVTNDGAPVPGARIATSIEPETLASLDVDPFPLRDALPSPGQTATTDNLGRARLEGVPPGLVAVRATAQGCRGVTDRAVVPSTGPAVAEVTFVLLRAPGVSGLVRDAGKPAAGLTIRAGVDRIDEFDVRAETK